MGQFRCEAVKQQAKNDLEYLQSLDNKLKDWNVTVPASIKSSLEVWEIWGGCITQLGTPHFDDDRRVAWLPGHMKSKKTADFLLGNLDEPWWIARLTYTYKICHTVLLSKSFNPIYW